MEIRKKINAYTLIELLIVLAIIGVMLGLGVYGIIQFRRVTEANLATSELIASIKETKNRAKNNSIDTKNTTNLGDLITNSYAYLIRFDSNDAIRTNCVKLSAETWNNLALQCTRNTEPLKKSSFTNIGFSMDAGCTGVLFENLNEKIYITNVNTVNAALTTCRISIKFKDDNTTYKKLVIDSITGNITVE